DVYIPVSTRFSSHPSVSTLSSNSPKMATIFLGAGHLEEIPPTDATFKPQVQFSLHSMAFTWADINNNYRFDPTTEKRKTYEFAAAVTMKEDPATSKQKKRSKKKDMRLLVVADSDVVSDQVFRNAGNAYLLVDGVKWLSGEEKFTGETSSEEDVRIRHTRKEDQLWFYLTIFAVPALVLGAGFFYTRRRRKK
ncbi:MAG: hypothetical protein V1754_13910, partial [Pseudomonadota bacterium]